MQKIKVQKILAVCSFASMLVLSSGGLVLADVQTINENTGFASSNDVVATVAETFASLNSNAQVIANVGEGTVSSGGNLIDDNTSGGDAVTGVVSLDGEFINNTNTNTLNHSGSWLSDPTSENDTTGAESVNNATSILSELTSASNTNIVDADNLTAVEAVSGNNEIADNTGAGFVGTGSVDGALMTDNTVNSNFLDLISSGTGDLVSEAFNNTTGFGSVNDAVVAVDNTVTTQNTNNADLDNDVFALLSSGGNIITDNTGSAEMSTGDASGITAVANDVNSNTTEVTADLGGFDISVGNSTTGADSVNAAEADVSQLVASSNSNTAAINNNVTTTASSGGNEISDNTDSAVVSTGDASNAVAIANGANDNSTSINLGLGGLGVSALNDTTGSGSVNNADATVDMAVVSENTNSMDVVNSVNSSSFSGGNVASGNTGSVDLDTGSASTDTAIVNDVNTNTTDIDMAPSGTVSAGNSSTGADSVNGSSASVTNAVVVSNTNDANITNTVVSTSNSGGNDVSGNTGGGSVSTGSASLTFGAANTGNSNTTTIGQ